MEKDNLQQKIMEMDETMELLLGSNQDTNPRMVRQPSPEMLTIWRLIMRPDYRNIFCRVITSIMAAASSAGG